MGRLRRLRTSAVLRDMVRENHVSQKDLICPFFVVEGSGKKEEISSMPNIFRYSVDELLKAVSRYVKLGGTSVILFGLPDQKDARGSAAYDSDGIVQKAVRVLKKEFPNLLIVTDVCLCAYTDHGHCGLLNEDEVDNDETIKLLAQMALSHAQAGADIIAPSDMMDYRVEEIRDVLDEAGFVYTPIMSYAVKYSSAFYGPFRDAANSSPAKGDRKTYQMDPANAREAIREALQDIDEDADFIMVKPALAYMDIIKTLREKILVPLVAYNVSGEYAMVKAAAEKGWIDERAIVMETLLSLKRAGADIIITYHALDVLGWMKEG